MDDRDFITPDSDPLDDEIVSSIAECAREIEAQTGIELRFSSHRNHGVNVWGMSFGEPRIHVANFYFNGAYSSYDGWEYGDERSDVMYGLLKDLVRSLSDDGEVHFR